jgi:4-hydroxy-3-polyprenylbenzoate decarboxylase
MYFKNLPDFLLFLEENNHLRRINHTVDSVLEVTEISKRSLELAGPALLFENIIKKDGKKSTIPLLTNLYAHIDRIAFSLGLKSHTELRKFGELLAILKSPEAPSSIREIYNMLPLAKRVLSMKPKILHKSPCQEIILKNDAIDLNILPIQTCWPGDVSELITWPIVVTKGPNSLEKTDNYNLGIYRNQVIGRNKLIMRWLKMRGGAQQYERWKKSNTEPFPLAIVLGAPPAITMSAVMPIPDNMSEYNFSGLLQAARPELVKCKTIDILVPANSEIILEGHVSLTEYASEGPFGDHTGYYNSVESFPIFTISAITMKKNPIYLSTYTGKPPDEPSILGEALGEIFIPLIINQFPEIVDFYLPPEACSYRFAIVSIKKSYPGHAKRIMMGIWSFLRQFMYTKFVIIVDEDINIRNWKEVIWAISTRCDPVRDTLLIDNTPIDYLDFASQYSGLGSKIGIDATNKIHPETTREWGVEIKMSETIKKKIDKIWNELRI